MVLTGSNAATRVHRRVNRLRTFNDEEGFYRLTFHAMGILCRLYFRSPKARLTQDFKAEVLCWVARFEGRYSRLIPESLVSRINQSAGHSWVVVEAETDGLFNLCQDMVFLTRGPFDPTALPLIECWNPKTNSTVIPDKAAVAMARELVGWRKVKRRRGAVFLPLPGMCLDSGAIAKEYAVDRVVLLGFGQEVHVQAAPPEKGAWQVGLGGTHASRSMLDQSKGGRSRGGLLQRLSATLHLWGQPLRAHHRSAHRLPRRQRRALGFGHRLQPHIRRNPLDELLPTVAQRNAESDQPWRGVESCLVTQSTLHESQGFYAYTSH